MKQVEAGDPVRVRLVMVGVSHQEASLESRERLRVGPQLAQDFCARLAAKGGEAVVLSTCNRTEIYLATADVAALKLGRDRRRTVSRRRSAGRWR